MSELSPAAWAVLNAVTRHQYDLNPEDIPNEATRIACEISIALRAARDELAPSKTIKDIDYVHQSYVDGYKDALDEILAIAIELEAQ